MTINNEWQYTPLRPQSIIDPPLPEALCHTVDPVCQHLLQGIVVELSSRDLSNSRQYFSKRVVDPDFLAQNQQIISEHLKRNLYRFEVYYGGNYSYNVDLVDNRIRIKVSPLNLRPNLVKRVASSAAESTQKRPKQKNFEYCIPTTDDNLAEIRQIITSRLGTGLSDGDVFCTISSYASDNTDFKVLEEEDRTLHMICCKMDDRILGVTSFEHEISSNTVEVQVLAVKKGWDGLGIGSNLLKKIISFAAKTGCTSITLFSSNQAVSFYGKYGFKVAALSPVNPLDSSDTDTILSVVNKDSRLLSAIEHSIVHYWKELPLAETPELKNYHEMKLKLLISSLSSPKAMVGFVTCEAFIANFLDHGQSTRALDPDFWNMFQFIITNYTPHTSIELTDDLLIFALSQTCLNLGLPINRKNSNIDLFDKLDSMNIGIRSLRLNLN